jgi:hypothetical protein
MTIRRYFPAFAAVFAAALAVGAAGQTAPKAPNVKGQTPAHVSGTVVDASRRPLPDVSLSITAIGANAPDGARVFTDSSGRYFSAVTGFNGKYKVTPSLAGYTFRPASTELSGAGGTADFQGTKK